MRTWKAKFRGDFAEMGGRMRTLLWSRVGMVGREEGEDEPVALSWKRRAISKTIPLVYPCVGRL